MFSLKYEKSFYNLRFLVIYLFDVYFVDLKELLPLNRLNEQIEDWYDLNGCHGNCSTGKKRLASLENKAQDLDLIRLFK